ncbi:MAG: AAA family ATPase [Candidatus Sumerlaeaceae bacterium]|nr:AAA family ATPase [Candidatus Sumerlaeaceae bacterium]
MYNKFFGLAEAPFNITPDWRFLFLSQRHREALSALVYGIRERKGFILLTGEIGSGKTTVCRALVHDLKQDNMKLALILNPGLSELELLKAINDEFQIPSFYNTKKGLIDELNRFLITENQKGNNVVLIIDEAQNLDPALLEQIRMLSNLETEDTKLIQIVLIGQPELNETLSLSQLEQLNQRIAVRFHLTPLSPEDMHAYIKHRLFVARAKIDVEFTDAALKMAHVATRGIPRKINVLCDRALLGCYVEGSYTVDERIMQKAIQEIAGDAPAPADSGGAAKTMAATIGRILTRRVAIVIGAMLSIMAVVAVSVAIGVRWANHNNPDQSDPQAERIDKMKIPAEPPIESDGGAQSATDNTTTGTGDSKSVAVPATPTPATDWDAERRKNPNWKYDKNSPLVRVNSPKTVLRAAQLSILKMWGITIDLGEMAKLGEDMILNGELKSDAVKIRIINIPGGFREVVRLNVPMIIKMKDSGPDRSENVVLLRAEGEAVTVGDPVWGVRVYKAGDFSKRWGGATAICVDVNQLSTLNRGDRNERVRALQEFLKGEKYLDEVTGVYDIKTTEAIKKFQEYYGINGKSANGQIDDVTLLVLNSRMMRNGPRLNAADQD